MATSRKEGKILNSKLGEGNSLINKEKKIVVTIVYVLKGNVIFKNRKPKIKREERKSWKYQYQVNVYFPKTTSAFEFYKRCCLCKLCENPSTWCLLQIFTFCVYFFLTLAINKILLTFQLEILPQESLNLKKNK